MSKQQKTNEVFAFFNGPTELGRLLNVNQSAASNWKRRGFPADKAIKIELLSRGKFKAADLCCNKNN